VVTNLYTMRLLLFIIVISITQFSFSQHSNEFYNNGSLVHVQAGALIHVQGDVHMFQGTGLLENNGLIVSQGNTYSDNVFQQRGTGTFRFENSSVNVGERQFISGSYAVRGGQAQNGVSDGSFYNLELVNDQGVVYLVGTGNIADVRNSVDFIAGITANRIITHNVGMTGAIANPANGVNYTGVFGIMNPTASLVSMPDNTVTTSGNMSGVDNQYVQGKLRRAIAAGGGSYGFVLGVEPAGAGAQRGMQYARIDFAPNSYDVITGYFQSGSSNASPVLLECSGNSMNYFGGTDHGEWMYTDITGSGVGTYALNVWPQDDNFITSSPWMITKDNSFQGTANDCGPTPVGLSRAGFNGFNTPSEFDVAAPISPLPVELIQIWIETNSNNLEVNWDVASEQNVNYYELQRSTDAVNFAHLTALQAAGNTNTSLHYEHKDFTVNRNQDYYYRYKGVDFDGMYYYSPIVVGRLNSEGSDYLGGEISVYPNPTFSNVNIAFEFDEEKDIEITIYNAIGQQILNTALYLEEGYTVVPIQSEEWAAGIYTLRVIEIGTEVSVWKKFIKN
jgi:hypothetical protein